LKVNSRLAKVWQRAFDILNPLASMDDKATGNLRVPEIKALKVGCQRLLAGLAFSVSDAITGWDHHVSWITGCSAAVLR
jgi:hypothetical protein